MVHPPSETISTAQDTKACVSGCDRNFLTGARAMLQTARHFHPEVKRYLLTYPGDVDCIQDALGELAHVRPFPRGITGVPERYLTSYARLFIPDMFTEDVVAWVDSDAIFVNQANRLWEVPPGQIQAGPNLAYPLWPIGRWMPDEYWPRYAALFPEIQPTDRGFNAGVFALRPADWRGLVDRFERAIAEIGFDPLPFITDQTILNGIFFGRVTHLPAQYNFHCFLDPSVRVPEGITIYHYAGAPKPWEASYPRLHPAYYCWEKYVLGRSSLGLAWRSCLINCIGIPKNIMTRARRRFSRMLQWSRDQQSTELVVTPGSDSSHPAGY